jgi:glycosyltransferase involved in cell wall biosynthesis
LNFYRVYKRWKPDIVHHFTIKPVIYGSIAAHFAKIPIIINTITGMGYLFTDKIQGRPWIKPLVLNLYRTSVRVSDYYFFQNREDRDFFVERNIISKEKAGIVPGSGVNTDYFNFQHIKPEIKANLKSELNIGRTESVVLCVSRMLYDKGIAEYVESATLIRRNNKGVRFLLVGPLDPGNPAQIPEDVIQKWTADGTIEYLGRRDDIRELMSIADIVVHPSYREGFPRVLLEAASMEKPIVTTDTIGCKEVVKHKENGLLVPIKNIEALSNAITSLIEDPELRRKFGKNARERAINEFDEILVIDKTFEVYKIFIMNKNKKESF